MKFTQEDLLNAMGLKIGDNVVVDCVEPILKIEVFELNYYPTLWWSDGNVTDISELIGLEYEIITPPKYTLTETEKHIVLAIDDYIEQLNRSNGELFGVYKDKDGKIIGWVELPMSKLFPFIKDNDYVSLDELREIAKK